MRRVTRFAASSRPEGAIAVTAKRTKQPSNSGRPKRGRADLKRIRRMAEKQIEQTSPPELADLPEDFWSGAELVTVPAKEAISLRLDQDVLRWFREGGPRYQSRMNAVLRSYVQSMRDGPMKTRRRPKSEKHKSKRVSV